MSMMVDPHDYLDIQRGDSSYLDLVNGRGDSSYLDLVDEGNSEYVNASELNKTSTTDDDYLTPDGQGRSPGVYEKSLEPAVVRPQNSYVKHSASTINDLNSQPSFGDEVSKVVEDKQMNGNIDTGTYLTTLTRPNAGRSLPELPPKSEVYDTIPDGESSHCCKCCKATCCRCAIFWAIILVLAGLGGAGYGIYVAITQNSPSPSSSYQLIVFGQIVYKDIKQQTLETDLHNRSAIFKTQLIEAIQQSNNELKQSYRNVVVLRYVFDNSTIVGDVLSEFVFTFQSAVESFKENVEFSLHGAITIYFSSKNYQGSLRCVHISPNFDVSDYTCQLNTTKISNFP